MIVRPNALVISSIDQRVAASGGRRYCQAAGRGKGQLAIGSPGSATAIDDGQLRPMARPTALIRRITLPDAIAQAATSRSWSVHADFFYNSGCCGWKWKDRR